MITRKSFIKSLLGLTGLVGLVSAKPAPKPLTAKKGDNLVKTGTVELKFHEVRLSRGDSWKVKHGLGRAPFFTQVYNVEGSPVQLDVKLSKTHITLNTHTEQDGLRVVFS